MTQCDVKKCYATRMISLKTWTLQVRMSKMWFLSFTTCWKRSSWKFKI